MISNEIDDSLTYTKYTQSICVHKTIEKLWKKMHQFVIIVTSEEKWEMGLRKRRGLSTVYLQNFKNVFRYFGIILILITININMSH